MATLDDNSGSLEVLRYRVGKNEEKLVKLDDWQRVVDYERATNKEILTQISKDIIELKGSFDSNRKAFLQFALSVAVSAIVFALGILAATGRLHR